MSVCLSLFSPQHERKAMFQRFAVLYYKFSPVLVKHTPKETVAAWISAGKQLDPKKLIPALIQCTQPEDSSQGQLVGALLPSLFLLPSSLPLSSLTLSHPPTLSLFLLCVWLLTLSRRQQPSPTLSSVWTSCRALRCLSITFLSPPMPTAPVRRTTTSCWTMSGARTR